MSYVKNILFRQLSWNYCLFWLFGFLILQMRFAHGNPEFHSICERTDQADVSSLAQTTPQNIHSQQQSWLHVDSQHGPTDNMKDRECPDRCTCKTSGYVKRGITDVNCSSRGLQTIPYLPSTTQKAFFQDNLISLVDCEVFKHTTDIKTLNLSGNLKLKIESCAFQSLGKSLEHLDMSYIREEKYPLDMNTFKGLKNLIDLNLRWTHRDSLPAGMFSDLGRLQKLDLSANDMNIVTKETFIGLHSLTHLKLAGNDFAHVLCKNTTKIFFYLQKLQILDLSYCRINCLKADIFAGLSSLTHLYLKENFYFLGYISDNAFRGLERLKVLNLASRLHGLNRTYPDKALMSLSGLEELYLVGLPNTVLGPGFQKMTNIRVLDFSGRECNMSTINSSYFQNIRSKFNLTLSVSRCKITKLSNDTFKSLPNLYSLDLSRNLDLRFTKFEDWSSGFVNSSLRQLNVSSISTGVTYLNKSTFQYLKNTNLEKLIIKENRIFKFDSEFLPPTLKYLDVSYNDFSLSAFASHVHRLKNLKVFIADSVSKFHFVKNRSRILTNPVGLIDMWNSMANIRAKDNLLANVSFHDNNYSCEFKLPTSLQCVSLRHSALAATSLSFCPQNYSIRYLDLVKFRMHGYLLEHEKPLQGFHFLEYLDISYNKYENMSLHFFQYTTNIQHLLMHECSLGNVFHKDIQGLLLSSLHKLRTLNMRNNSIKYLSEHAFSENIQLEVLNLSENELTQFSLSLSNLENLTFLDLSKNHLLEFNQWNVKDLQRLKSINSNFQIDLYGNRFLFSCDNIPFMQLTMKEPDIFTHVELLQFYQTNGKSLNFTEMIDFLLFLEKECTAVEMFFSVLVLFFLMSGCIIVSAVVYHKRWRLTYLYYIGQRRNHIGGVAVTYKPEADLFITYDQDEFNPRHLVLQTFLPILTRAGIRYIIGERDFPGGNLMSHITGAITGSRKTLILLSNDIFLEPHREMEMNLAIMREIDTRAEILVPVFVEDVDLTLYPREITTFLQHQRHRCLVYENSPVFWNNFISAINREYTFWV